MAAKRWANQDVYADLIESYASANGVPAALAYGVIAQESGFNPNAVRNEPSYRCAATGQTGDASYGLMQLLYCTALGLGFSGNPTALFDPGTNLAYGLQLLSSLLRSHGGDVGAALSAYNGGDRRSLGYGARRSDGTFANQSYVTNILNNTDYFEGYLAARDTPADDGSDTSAEPDTGTAVDGDASAVGEVVAALAVAAIGYAVVRALRG